MRTANDYWKYFASLALALGVLNCAPPGYCHELSQKGKHPEASRFLPVIRDSVIREHLRKANLSLTVGATVTVNSTTDVADGDTSSIDNLKNHPGVDGVISLREAIVATNSTANSTMGADMIIFDIGTGTPTISVGGSPLPDPNAGKPLPEITDAVIIDGRTGGATRVELDGTKAGSGANGLYITAGNSEVRGLVIKGFSGAGIRLESKNLSMIASGTTIIGNIIGGDITDTDPGVNGGNGIEIINSNGNTIGGDQATCGGPCNLISGNGNHGIRVEGAESKTNIITGNYIGTKFSGDTASGNKQSGISILDSPSNIIGGARSAGSEEKCSGLCNLLSGNISYGILIEGNQASGNSVTGNFIGLDMNGVAAIPNFAGVIVRPITDTSNTCFPNTSPSGTEIGKRNSRERNVISGNNSVGISLQGANTKMTRIVGNYIGTRANGREFLGNKTHGLLITEPIPDSCAGQVASETQIEGNVISGNLFDGIRISFGSDKNNVWGNFIGTSFDGTVPLGNMSDGIEIDDSSSNNIGGPEAGKQNVISANKFSGVFITRQTTDPMKNAKNNFLLGNYIGTNGDGDANLGNGQGGVLIDDQPDNTIGGTVSGARNIISGNSVGIQIRGERAARNLVQGNYVGTKPNGMEPLPNQQIGVSIVSSTTDGGAAVSDCFANSNHIGGETAAARNLISGNQVDGIQIVNGMFSCVQGNYIGTDATGKGRLQNGRHGVVITTDPRVMDKGPTKNIIGGGRATALCDAPCNIISGNDGNGVVILGEKAAENVVKGNYIGIGVKDESDPTTPAPRPNAGSGILILQGASQNTIGGERASTACTGPCNVISGNAYAGVGVEGGNTNANFVKGNYIGVDPEGQKGMPNLSHGVYLSNRMRRSPCSLSISSLAPIVPDPEAAFAIHSGLNNKDPWVRNVVSDVVANVLRGTVDFNDPQSVGGILKYKGFLFETLANQEFGWKRTETPGEARVDAIEPKNSVDEKERYWQAKSTPLMPCGDAVKLLPDDESVVFGLILPLRTDIGNCSAANVSKLQMRKDRARIRNSMVITDQDAEERIRNFVDYAKSLDCSMPAPIGQPTRDNEIGGDRLSALCDGPCNVIAGNSDIGIVLDGDQTTGNKIKGNYVGVSPLKGGSGLETVTIRNALGGIRLHNAPGNLIGGSRAVAGCNGPCNVISGNGLTGVLLYGGMSTSNLVIGNFIGVDPTGAVAVANEMAGVALKDGASDNKIGDSRNAKDCDGPCNVISGNGTDGILIWGPGTDRNFVKGNYIGVKADDSGEVPNRQHGVAIEEGASEAVIGSDKNATLSRGDCIGDCNIIRGNGANGVAVIGPAIIGGVIPDYFTNKNTIRGNALHGNSRMGIDLKGDGPTPNDRGDGDGGPNDLINFPVVTADYNELTNVTTVTIKLDTLSPDTAKVDIYEGAKVSPSSFLETPMLINGEASFSKFRKITTFRAVATADNGSTSEISIRPPLIFIPGVAGSRLIDDNDAGRELWIGLFSSLNPTGHRTLNLYPNDADSKPNVSAPDVLRSLGYEALLSVLVDRGGYREYEVNNLPARRTTDCDVSGQKINAPTLFVFAYDWRKSMDDNAQLLKQYVDCVQQFYPGTKVDILAHSMGGLLARRYIVQNPDKHNVDRMITIGAPWLGAPKVLDILETGHWTFIQPMFRDTVKYITGSMTGMHQLLPSKSYFDLIRSLPDTSKDKLYPLVEAGVDLNGDGTVDQTPDYSTYLAILDSRFGRDSNGGPAPGSMNPNRVFSPGTTTDKFHNTPSDNQDNWSGDKSGVGYFHIFGVKSVETTVGQVRAEHWLDCRPVLVGSLAECLTVKDTFRTTWTRGDGTVPLISAMRKAVGSSSDLNALGAKLIPIEGSIFNFFNEGADHVGMLGNTEVHDSVLGILSNSEGPGAASTRPGVHGKAFKPSGLTQPSEPAYYLTISGVSVVTVTDDSGHTSTPAQAAPQGTLPEVTVMEVGDKIHSLAIPVARPYTVSFEKTSDPLTIEVRKGTGNTTTQAIRYLDLDPNIQLPTGAKAAIRLTELSIENLRYDSNNDGVVDIRDMQVIPTLMFAASDPLANDTTPPTITAVLEADVSDATKLRVTLDAQDASGIQDIYYSVDGRQFHSYGGPFRTDPVLLHVFADDRAGNRGVLERQLPDPATLPKLIISMITAAPDPVSAGSDITYRITVKNTGASAAQSVKILVCLPLNTTWASPCGGVPGVSCSRRETNPDIVQAEIPSVAGNGGMQTITVVAKLNCSVADGAKLIGRASLTSQILCKSDSAMAEVTVSNPAPTLSITVPGILTSYICGEIIPVPANLECSTTVNYRVQAGGKCPITTLCSPPSGSSFPVGLTSVACEVTDSAGVTRTCAFTLNVTATPGSNCGITSTLKTGRMNHTATLLQNGKVLVAGGSKFSGGLSSAELYDPANGTWSVASSMINGRANHTATLLPNGNVLVAGGDGTGVGAELYDPATNVWSKTGDLSASHSHHTATFVAGTVLVAGGNGSGSDKWELYDPAAGAWIRTGDLNVARSNHTATLLHANEVLIAGGVDAASRPLDSAERFDAFHGIWTYERETLKTTHVNHTATLLPDGNVLVAGGITSAGTSVTAELYNSITRIWSKPDKIELKTPRENHTATLLPNGKVLVIGGNSTDRSTEQYSPGSGAPGFWTTTESLSASYSSHTATLLPNGSVLIVGETAELFDPAKGMWSASSAKGNLNVARQGHTATLMPDGKVLLAAGFGVTSILFDRAVNSAELYDPTGDDGKGSSNFTDTPLKEARASHTATLLPNGKVLVVGGLFSLGNFPIVPLFSSLSSAELYDPTANGGKGSWNLTDTLKEARASHTATLLSDGKVLVVGGSKFTRSVGPAPVLDSGELYDPATEMWEKDIDIRLHTARTDHTATLLSNGEVLVVGGGDSKLDSLKSVELYDPKTRTWVEDPISMLNIHRRNHTATLLPDGTVLVAGGSGSNSTPLDSAELYDPITKRWGLLTNQLQNARASHTATLLLNGKVLITGGVGKQGFPSGVGPELYDPATMTFKSTDEPIARRSGHTATIMTDGKVLVAGGVSSDAALKIIELYDAGLGSDEKLRPSVTTLTSPLPVPGHLAVEGSRFLGFSEASGGNTRSSATNYPLLQLRSLSNERTAFLSPNGMKPWSDSLFPSSNVVDFPMGFALTTVFTNGIPSVSQSVLVLREVKAPVPASSPATDSSVTVRAGLVTITFASVSSPREVTITPIEPQSAGEPPTGFEIDGSYAFDISTTAGVTGPIKICFKLPTINDADAFSRLVVLHNGAPVSGMPMVDFPSRTLCVVVDSLSPFVIAPRANPGVFLCPPDITVTVQAGQSAGVASYPSPVLNKPQGLAVSCSPPSGSSFPVGATTVTCTATGPSSVSICRFTVTVVVRVNPPASSLAIICSADINAVAPSGQGSVVINYPPPILIPAPGATVNCLPPSGSRFPIGGTIVVCKATNISGDMATCTFRVTVQTDAGFDVCLQDDSSGNTMLINSSTGDYQFKRCADGLTVDGRGNLIRQGSTLALEDYESDRRVVAEFEGSLNRGHASVQIFSLGATLTITDRDTSKNTCACP